MAFNGADDFSPGVCADAGIAASARVINAINQPGNEFILAFLFRRPGPVQPHDQANIRLSLSQNQFHPVIGDSRLKTGRGRDSAKLCDNFALIAGDNLQTAMGDFCTMSAACAPMHAR